MTTPFNPTGYPAVEEIDGNLAVRDPSNTGQYGIITADSFIGLTKAIGFLKALAGPDSKHPTVIQLPDNSIIPVPLAMYGLSGDDGVWLNQANTLAAPGLPSSTYLGGNGQVSGCVTMIANAVYSCATGVVVPPGSTFEGKGRGSVIEFSGTGAAVTCQGTQVPSTQTIQGTGSILRGFTVDGTNVSPTAISRAVEVGGQYDIVIEDVTVSNFTSSGTTAAGGTNPIGAVGFLVNCINNLTEKLYMRRCTVNNCGTPNFSTTPDAGGGAGLAFCHTGASSGSEFYCEIDIHFNQQPGQNCIVGQKNCNVTYGRIHARGNMNYPSSGGNGSAAIVVGVLGQQGHFNQVTWDVAIESDGSGTPPTTIYFSSNADNTIIKGSGRLNFNFSWTASNMPLGSFEFSSGPIRGDTVLSTPVAPIASPASGTGYTNNGIDAMVLVTGGTVSSILYDNNPTGQTSGQIYLPAGHTIKIVWTVQPSWAWINALPL